MAKTEYDIFISYRREGGYDTAKHLNDLLTRDGYKVSFDIDTLRSGDFDTQLFDRIDNCRDFILIVDKNAFVRTLNPSYDPQKDWMRCELSQALKKEKNIIPIFLTGTNGFPEGLPDDVAGVVTKNGIEFNRSYFDAFYDDLKKRFLISKPQRIKLKTIIIFITTLLCIAALVYFGTRTNKVDQMDGVKDSLVVSASKDSMVNKIDSTKLYYNGAFDDSDMLIKGLRRGIRHINKNGEETYTYKCGEVSTIKVYFDQIATVFASTDKDGGDYLLDINFGEIGSDENTFEYPDNEYTIGQCDVDGNGKDELIVAVSTSDEPFVGGVGYGIGINVFDLIEGKWNRRASLNTGTNEFPASARIVKNAFYIKQMRWEEKYILEGKEFVKSR